MGEHAPFASWFWKEAGAEWYPVYTLSAARYAIQDFLGNIQLTCI
jgi:hypothetical protein